MNLFSILLIALGLSFDSFVVSVSSGLCIPDLNRRKVFKIAGFFAFFHTAMPLIGWSLGIGFRKYIENYDYLIAFGLLSALGIRMIYGGLFPNKKGKRFNPLNNLVLLWMSMATTVDAMLIGISFALLKLPIIKPALIIGLTTFIFSAAGIFSGNRIKNIARSWVEILGGLIIISIGVSILFSHNG